MRMHMINPKILCRQHLLGNHNEIHKHKPSFEKKHSITGRVQLPDVAIEPKSMEWWHNIVADEMIRRGYNHKSPYTPPDISYLPVHEQYAKVDKLYSILQLLLKCPNCFSRYLDYIDDKVYTPCLLCAKCNIESNKSCPNLWHCRNRGYHGQSYNYNTLMLNASLCGHFRKISKFGIKLRMQECLKNYTSIIMRRNHTVGIVK